MSATVPSWRATKDVAVKDDLVEEVGRMIGYDSIQPVAPAILATVPPANEERVFQHNVRSLLATGQNALRHAAAGIEYRPWSA